MATKLFLLLILNFCSRFAFAQTNISDSALSVVRQLATHNTFESEYVGFAGSPSRQFALMHKLQDIATDQELFSLTKHGNAVVRVYAFIALCRVHSKLADKAYQQLSKDQATVSTLTGCIGGRSTVAILARQYYPHKQ
jgi:hypothetical protein